MNVRVSFNELSLFKFFELTRHSEIVKKIHVLVNSKSTNHPLLIYVINGKIYNSIIEFKLSLIPEMWRHFWNCQVEKKNSRRRKRIDFKWWIEQKNPLKNDMYKPLMNCRCARWPLCNQTVGRKEVCQSVSLSDGLWSSKSRFFPLLTI